MQTFSVNKKQDQKKLVRVLSLQFPEAPVHLFQKALKNRDIRVNGLRVRVDTVVQTGDHIAIYLKDEELFPNGRPLLLGSGTVEERGGLATSKGLHHQAQGQNPQTTGKNSVQPRRNYRLVYEDRHCLVVDKPQGMTVHPGGGTNEVTLIERLRDDFGKKELTLCHRLDRNTGGLVLVAKNHTEAAKLSQALQEQQVVKRYRCLVWGIPEEGLSVRLSDGDQMQELRAYWERPKNSDRVYIHDEKMERDLPIVTRYRVLQIFTQLSDLLREKLSSSRLQYLTKLEAEGPLAISDLEVELVTGRSHQIRAHLAHLGHPILGDGKYGRNDINKVFAALSEDGRLNCQQLFATSLLFGADLPMELRELRRKTLRIPAEYSLNKLRFRRFES